MKDCTLEQALDYSNEDVISRFMTLFEVDEQEAEILFEETKKWLWLCYRSAIAEKRFVVVIDDSLLIIDEMWHNFVLFTKDYQHYCMDKFGFYIHHQPTTKAEKENWKANFQESMDDYFTNIEEQYSIIYDLLGETTLLRWYEDFPKKYTKKQIKELMR